MVATQPKYWTYADLFDLPPENRYEIIAGRLYQMPAPDLAHSDAFANLFLLLGPVVHAMGGRLHGAPTDVFLPDRDVVQPDILVLLPDRLAQRGPTGITGPPNLIIEIVSPTSSTHDRQVKRALYARSGVPEYWLADPRRQSIEVLVLRDGVYHRHCLVRGEELVSSLVLPDLAFPAAAAFA